MDFKNVFPTMSHDMVAAALGLRCIPLLYIRLILHLLRALYLYTVGKGYVPGVYHYLRAGTRQGDPVSLALFSLVASFVVFPLQDLDPGLTIMMYADDLIIFLNRRANPQLLVVGEGMEGGILFWTLFSIEDKLEPNGCNISQLRRTRMGQMFWGYWSGSQNFRQVSRGTLGKYSATSR